MDKNWIPVDFEDTLKEFEFTRKVIHNMNSVVYSAEFEDMDSTAIFTYLYENLDQVSFKDYLKRYIYEHNEIDDPYSEVPEDVYKDILRKSFRENDVPFSMQPTTKKISAIVNGWFTQENVKRSTIFLLGFGLRMSKEDVSEFLTKVIREEDMSLLDPEEVIYWYCYKNSCSYAEAKDLIQKYESYDENEPIDPNDVSRVQNMIRLNDLEIESPDDFELYLKVLKRLHIQDDRQNIAYAEFSALVDRTKQIIADIYQEDEDQKREVTPDNIGFGDIEKVICNGIPVTPNGNLQKMAGSVLAKKFRQKRMSRQRLESVASKSLKVDRFDLITLKFFICSQEQQELEPEKRLRIYLDETNAILEKCGMMKIYPVNPYEACVLMSLLADCPLATYSEILELSYSVNKETPIHL